MGSGPCYEQISALDHATNREKREKDDNKTTKKMNLRHSAWFPQNGN
jgi:hypothetical protein